MVPSGTAITLAKLRALVGGAQLSGFAHFSRAVITYRPTISLGGVGNVIGNIFYRSHEGAFIGDGRDNLVENNLFIGSDPAVHVDARGLTFHRQHIVEGERWNMYGKLRNVRHDQPPYSEAYPELRTLLEGDPARPEGNRVVRNASFGGRWLRLPKMTATTTRDAALSPSPHASWD